MAPFLEPLLQGSVPSVAPKIDHLPHGLIGLVRYPALNLWLILVVALFLLLLGVLVYWLYHRNKAKPSHVPEPVVDPYDELNKTILALEPSEPFTGKAVEDYYFELGLLFRRFIELKTKVPATDLTYKELLSPLRAKLPLSPTELDGVFAFFKQADFIKFAKAKSDIESARESHKQVCRWVSLMMPKQDDVLSESKKGRKGL